MSNRQDDLDLLLSLQERVPETPPSSPRYDSDEGISPSRKVSADLSGFREVVRDCLDYEPNHVEKTAKSNHGKASKCPEVEKFSGLQIRNQLVTPAELREHFSDIRFVRLSAMKNAMSGDSLSGCWATVGVLTEKGIPRSSSTGKDYCIWKIGCLNETTVSLFLFGDAYKAFGKEKAGMAFALFNCAVRKDSKGQGFSLSVYQPKQVLKIGTSVDYAVCSGKSSNDATCTAVINRRHGVYCKFHKSRESQKYTTMRTELKGGNIRSAYRDPHALEGVYMVDPMADKAKNSKQPLKLLSVEGLKKALSSASKVTTNLHSQGIRFLSEMTGKVGTKNLKKESTLQSQQKTAADKRKTCSSNADSSVVSENPQQNAKRNKTEKSETLPEKSKQGSGKMIELYYVSSEEEI